MEDDTAEMIRDMAFSVCPQCGTAIVPNHKGRPKKSSAHRNAGHGGTTPTRKPENGHRAGQRSARCAAGSFPIGISTGWNGNIAVGLVPTGAGRRRRTGVSKKIIGVYPMFNNPGYLCTCD